MSEKGGGDFLHTRYPNLQKSGQVQRSVEKKERIEHIKTPNNPKDRNEVFLDRLENIFDNSDEKKRTKAIRIFKNSFLYPDFLIDKNNIPDSYFELQLKIARERGQGGDLGKIKTVADIDQQTRKKEGETIHNDQKKSLDNWIDYLSSTDAQYPTWFKYYTLTSISKMGIYDKEKHEFSKRTKETTTIFPDLNREALAYTYDNLEKYYLKHEKHDNDELQKIIEGANFSKIYAFALDKGTPISKENKERIEGEWTKFNQGDDPTALYESLQGHGTGWCTAGEEAAKSQLKGGDFYVYYSKDEKGLNTIPRIAIRMENNKVAEVRGIEKDQNMEASMTDIAKEKYHQLPGGEKFDKKDHDMKLLTLIDKKTNENQELSKDELKFLYELGTKIEGFGYQKDPRIEEIKSKRNFKSDLTIIYDCSFDQIVDSSDQITEETRVYLGDLNQNDFDILNNRKNPLAIHGNVDFYECTSLTSIPENVTFNGYAFFKDCTSLTSIPKNTIFNGNADFENCISLTSIPKNTIFNGNADFDNCTSLTSISENITFNRNANFYNCTSLKSIPENTTFNEDANFDGCTDLTSISENTIFNGKAHFSGCTSLTSIPKNTTFNENAYFLGCTSLTSIQKNIIFNREVNFNNCTSLTSIPKNTTFNGNADFENCTSLTSISENTVFSGNAIFENCISLTSIPENTTFNEYTNFKGCASLVFILKNTIFKGEVDFRNCRALASISENITFNGYVNFYKGTSLTSISENTIFKDEANFYDCNLSEKLIKQLKRMEEQGKIKKLLL